MKKNKAIKNTASVLLALILWQTLALIINKDALFASPLAVIKRLFVLLGESAFYGTLLYSFVRIAAGFLLGAVSGFLLGISAGKSKTLEVLLMPYTFCIKSVPVASFIVIALIWLNSAVLSVAISFLIVLPVVYNNVLEGFRAADIKMLEFAEVFRLSPTKTFLYIRMPSVKPYLISSCKTAIGLAFKSGIAAEIIGLPSGSIGEMLYDAKIYFDSESLFAWTVMIVVLCVIFEKIFCFGISKLFEKMEKSL